MYQCQSLRRFDEAKTLLANNHQTYCSSVTDCLKSRLQWSDISLTRDIIVILETQGWQKIVDEQQSSSVEDTGSQQSLLGAVVRVGNRFQAPLEAAGVNIDELLSEFEDMLDHATQFISLSTLNYQEVWWRVFHSPDAGRWSNLLSLAQLLLSLPASNGKLERIFSTMKIIKTDKRSSLNNDT